jgi:hypothetical protein
MVDKAAGAAGAATLELQDMLRSSHAEAMELRAQVAPLQQQLKVRQGGAGTAALTFSAAAGMILLAYLGWWTSLAEVSVLLTVALFAVLGVGC